MTDDRANAAEAQYLEGIAEGLAAPPVWGCPTCGRDMDGNYEECFYCFRERMWVRYGPIADYFDFEPVEVTE